MSFLFKNMALCWVCTLLVASSHPLFAESDRDFPDGVMNLGYPVNGFQEEFSPSLDIVGNLYYNSRRDEDPYRHIYRFPLYQDGPREAQPIPEIATDANDVSPFVAYNGAVLIFASDRPGSTPVASSDPDKSRRSYDIYWSAVIQGKWKPPRRLSSDINTAADETNPRLSRDGKTLYFTRSSPDQKSMIMKATFDGQDFHHPEAMPSMINSGYGEMGLTPVEELKGFLFASARPGGHGGWDLYFLSYRDGHYGLPVNLGGEVNTEHNEVQPSTLDSVLYFASDRTGDYDIYRATQYSIEYRVRLKLIDQMTGDPVSTSVRVQAGSGDTGGLAFAEVAVHSDEKGLVVIPVHPSLQRLQILITDSDYLPVILNLVVEDAVLDDVKILMKPIRKDASFDIHAIHFEYNSDDISKDSYSYLNALAEYMIKNKRLRFEIIGHTDLKGSQAFNKKLSRKRAESVKRYLEKAGVEPSRMIAIGMGKLKPLVKKRGPGYDEKNRRTEFKLLND